MICAVGTLFGDIILQQDIVNNINVQNSNYQYVP